MPKSTVVILGYNKWTAGLHSLQRMKDHLENRIIATYPITVIYFVRRNDILTVHHRTLHNSHNPVVHNNTLALMHWFKTNIFSVNNISHVIFISIIQLFSFLRVSLENSSLLFNVLRVSSQFFLEPYYYLHLSFTNYVQITD